MAGGGGSTYQHIDYVRQVKSDSEPIKFQFTAASTMLVDEANLFVHSVGNRHINSYACIRDLKSGNIVGKRSVFQSPTVKTLVLVKGFKATLIKGRKYYLEIGHVTDTAIDSLTVAPTRTVVYSSELLVYNYGVTDPVWRIPAGNGFISIGGWQSYKDQGYFIRTFDVGTIASNLVNNGNFYFSDIVPNGTLMFIDLYYTDNDLIAAEQNLTNWNFYASNVEDGIVLEKHRYWRAYIEFASNTTRDETPELADMTVQYRSKPKTFGTVIETKKDTKTGFFIKTQIPMVSKSYLRVVKNGSKTLSSFNIQSSKVNPKFQVNISGGFNATIAEDDYSSNVFNKNLAARESRIRVGYRDVNSTIELYKGRILDTQYSKGRFILTSSDAFKLFDIKIPSTKAAGAWDGTASYLIGDNVVYFGALYAATADNTGEQPDISPASWNTIGGAWNDITYDSTSSVTGQNWHLVDMLLDIILNRVNVHTSMVDVDSFESARTAFPDRKGYIYIKKPTSAKNIINELCWLLESHIVIANGKVSLIVEPGIDSDISFEFKGNDIKQDSLVYRAGWKDIVNECIILSAYDSSGDDNTSNYLDGEVVIDYDSVAEFDYVSSEVFKDKFNIPVSELQNRCETFVNKWKRGRGLVSFTADINKFTADILDVVNIESNQLPDFTYRKFSGIIIEKDVDWINQQIKFKVLEIK